ncbi:hypothetical protein [Actinomadura fibrosa]|uniref:Uncharacterized protein n=1 Tax=Actinomadura fibrosa TaxID=111802 RepID=A0ABW2XUL8_9ACTN|nr:hypothetical protein [Actinomadura fibrosa]
MEAARKARTAVVFAWSSWSGNLSTPLPEGQGQLVAEVAAIDPNTIVVLNQPFAMPVARQGQRRARHVVPR